MIIFFLNVHFNEQADAYILGNVKRGWNDEATPFEKGCESGGALLGGVAK